MKEEKHIRLNEETQCHTQKKNNKIIRRAYGIISGLCVGLLLCFAVIMLFVVIIGREQDSFPAVLNHQLYIIRSNSMSPALKAGSLAIVKLAAGSDIREGDIITYQRIGNTTAVTHRVVEVVQGEELQFITKGDANNTKDALPVPANAVIGRVTLEIPFAGYILAFSGTRQGALVLLIIPGVLILLYQIYHLFKHFHKRNNA